MKNRILVTLLKDKKTFKGRHKEAANEAPQDSNMCEKMSKKCKL